VQPPNPLDPRTTASYGRLVIELGSREREQPAPPLVVFRSLVDPHEPGARPWLELRDDETEPSVVESVEPVLVVWTSIWPNRPEDRIRFDLRPRAMGTALRWTHLSPEAPGAEELNRLRYRMNVLINAQLRFSYGQ
jgi:hypothetical protein